MAYRAIQRHMCFFESVDFNSQSSGENAPKPQILMTTGTLDVCVCVN